mmetsp:Transcript_17843/g.21674  ORF Transcript_17843/g.21674 Transcript_17843/m.21674 type:complete len:550 (-) Transcript_17843:123-1772(-)
MFKGAVSVGVTLILLLLVGAAASDSSVKEESSFSLRDFLGLASLIDVFQKVTTDNNQNGAANCEDLSDPSSCDNESGCTWCKSAAVPSKCYNKADASRLPPGVFMCDKSQSSGKKLEITLDTNKKLFGEKEGSVGLCDPNVRQIAGYFKLGDQNKNYFFWFFESRGNPSTDPVVLWMTGGPGCSSAIALFAENGPCKVNEDGTDTELNPYSWNEHANMIFIDQPAGTGFSYGTHDKNEVSVANDMYLFLTEFMDKYRAYASNKFFIFGESYAGHYVPATAHRVWKGNEEKERTHINLAGVSVGNGLTNPTEQYQWYAKMAYNSTTAPSRVTYSTYLAMQAATPVCVKLIEKCNVGSNTTHGYSCLAALNFCNGALFSPYAASGYNTYDMRIKCEVPGLCYDFSNIQKYLSSQKVLNYLNIPSNIHWQNCDPGVHADLMGDWMKEYENQIPDLLHAGIPVLIYAGDVDYVCNWLGNQAWVRKLKWKGHCQYNSAKEAEWLVDGKPAGKAQSFGGLTFLQVYQAGHMVPMDQPKVALEMLSGFVEGKPFSA